MRKITYWLLLILIFIVPWEDSVTVMLIGSIARIVGFIAAACWLGTLVSERRFRELHLFHYVVLGFFVWNLMSVYWSINPDDTVILVKTYGQMIVLIVILWEMCVRLEDLLPALQAYVLGGFVSIASTVINYMRGITISEYEVRFSAAGVNAVDTGILLVLGLPLAWHLFIMTRKGYKSRLLALVNLSYIPLAIYAVILTGSRTSMFVLVPVAVYICFSSRIKLTKKIVAVTGMAAALLIMSFDVPDAVRDRLGSSVRSVRSGELSGRVELWNKAADEFLDHPMIGSGAGTIFSVIGSAAHNTFLSILAETGIAGFALFMTILGIAGWKALKSPSGYRGVWLTELAVLVIGGLSLSWEFRKATWLVFSFIIIQGEAPYTPLVIGRRRDLGAAVSRVPRGQVRQW